MLVVVSFELRDRLLNFVVDTGTTSTVLDARHRDLLFEKSETRRFKSGDTETNVDFYDSPGLQFIGGLPLFDGPLGIFDLPWKDQVAIQVDGILGMDALAEWCVQLHFDARAVVWWRGTANDVVFWGKEEKLVYTEPNIPAVKCQFDNQPHCEFWIDTGLDSSIHVSKKMFSEAQANKSLRITNCLEVATPIGRSVATCGRVNSFKAAGV